LPFLAARPAPLVLWTTHKSLARYYKQDEEPAYWHRSFVWEDVKASYERFFELNPEEFGWRHDYAKGAYLCGHYDVFLQQAKLFPGQTTSGGAGNGNSRKWLPKPARSQESPGNLERLSGDLRWFTAKFLRLRRRG
jgi:hypothetical protein